MTVDRTDTASARRRSDGGNGGEICDERDSETDGRREPVLSVRDLKTYFDTEEGTIRAVDGVSFDVHRGETVCVVGESGSGKTATAESITRLIDSPPGRIAGGSIRFDGRELTDLDESELRTVRGERIGHVFQESQGALNPVDSIGRQVVESIRHRRDVSKEEAREEAIELLGRVGLPDAVSRFDDHPHELSGGMTKRVAIAIALARRPDLLIVDEPAVALDTTVRMQIFRLFEALKGEYGMSLLFFANDLGIVAGIADRVVVLYAGKVMERGSVFDVFDRPSHPYTQALFRSFPGEGGPGIEEARAIPGSAPNLVRPPDGCRFNPRCPHAIEDCRMGEQPPLYPVDDAGHVASCVYYREGYDESVVQWGYDESVVQKENDESTALKRNDTTGAGDDES